MIDRFTRWPEAIPLGDSKAETVAKAFYLNWVSRFNNNNSICNKLIIKRWSRSFSRNFRKIATPIRHAKTYDLPHSGLSLRCDWHAFLFLEEM